VTVNHRFLSTKSDPKGMQFVVGKNDTSSTSEGASPFQAVLWKERSLINRPLHCSSMRSLVEARTSHPKLEDGHRKHPKKGVEIDDGTTVQVQRRQNEVRQRAVEESAARDRDQKSDSSS